LERTSPRRNFNELRIVGIADTLRRIFLQKQSLNVEATKKTGPLQGRGPVVIESSSEDQPLMIRGSIM